MFRPCMNRWLRERAVQKQELHENQDFTFENHILKGPEIPTNCKGSNIGEFLLEAFNRTPDHVAQIDAETNNKTTYAEMKDCSIRCALWMEKEGFGSKDIVAIYTPSRLDSYIPMFATNFVQATLNFWLYGCGIDTVRHFLKLTSPKLIFVCADAVDMIEEAVKLENNHARIVTFDENPKYKSLNDILQSQSSIDVENYTPRNVKNSKDVAFILPTSGTTGFPKGVMISAEAMLNNVSNEYFCWGHKNVLWYGQMGGIQCTTMILICIYRNATRIISSNKDPRVVCETIEKFNVNYMNASPKILFSLANFSGIDEYNMDCLKLMLTGGSRLDKVTFKKLKTTCLRDKIHQTYGSTEIGFKRLLPKYGNTQTSCNSIGFVTPNLQLKIIDRFTKKTLGPNALGEMLIKTSTMMLGYYKNPEATNKVFDPEGWYHTGDIGYYDERGEIFIMDRISNAFQYCGQEIFTTDIEDIFFTHPAVMDVAVMHIPDKSYGKVPVAFVKIQSGKYVKEEELFELFTTFEKRNALRGIVHFMKEIPLNPHLKHDKKCLRELANKIINIL